MIVATPADQRDVVAVPDRTIAGGRMTVSPAGIAELIALGAAVVPAVVMVVRAATSGWVPLFDAAYFTVRSRDVLSAHNPQVGAWSMGSREVGVSVNNLGPLQLDLLAPFTRLDPYWGTALGVATANTAAIVGVWFVSRRLLGPFGVIGAMVATLLIQLNEGSLMLIEARQQLALILPMWCVLWLAAATWLGLRWALPWLAFVASFVLQTHFTYAYQTLAVAVAATIAFLVRHWSRRAALTRPLLLAVAVVALCWAQPLWDQLAGTGNLTDVLGESGGSERSVGASRGLRILAESVFVPPFFAPGSMGDLLREGSRTSLPSSVIALAGWAGLLALVTVRMGRRHRTLSAMAAVGFVTLAAAVLAAIKIPPTEQFGIIAQNYYWVWPMGIFMATAIVGAALRGPVAQLRHTITPRRADIALLGTAAVAALGAIPLLSPTNLLPETDHEWAVSRQVARPLIDQLGEGLAGFELDGPMLIELGAVRHVRYTLLAELQRHGIEFVFSPGATDLARFGRERCDDGSAAYLLTLRGGAGALQLSGDDTLLATVPGLADHQSDRLTELALLFGDAIRDGTVTVDDDGIVVLDGELPPVLDEVRTTPGMPARRLAVFLGNWSQFGAVDVPRELRDDLDEWQDLERAASDDRMAIYLRPISPHRPNRCEELEPGADFLTNLATS
jgi:hypothetical protein